MKNAVFWNVKPCGSCGTGVSVEHIAPSSELKELAAFLKSAQFCDIRIPDVIGMTL
jgi:hypothetical protein